MRIKDVIQENEQVNEFGEKVLGAVKGAAKGGFGNLIKGAQAGWQGGAGVQKGKEVAGPHIQQWNQAAGQMQSAGGNPTPDQLTNFVKKITALCQLKA